MHVSVISDRGIKIFHRFSNVSDRHVAKVKFLLVSCAIVLFYFKFYTVYVQRCNYFFLFFFLLFQ